MKCALLLERDPAERRDIAAQLRVLGYIVAKVDTPAMAVNAAHALRYDLILTDTTFNMADRRSFLGELERLAPHAPIVLLSSGEREARFEYRHLPVLDKPVTLRALRRVIEFGLDGYGMLPVAAPASAPGPARGHERRRHAPRRASGRLPG
jgi:CheY-like chemotaxis protein